MINDEAGVRDVSFAYSRNGQNVLEHVNVTIHAGEKVAVVLQKSELFSASIGENIAWGAPGAAEEAIRSAAVTAQAAPFIFSTAQGYETMVAERGMSLSGWRGDGQGRKR